MAFLKFKKWYYETAIAAGTEASHFLPGTEDFDSQTKRDYYAQHPEELNFARFLD